MLSPRNQPVALGRVWHTPICAGTRAQRRSRWRAGAVYPELCGDGRDLHHDYPRQEDATYPDLCGDGGLMLFQVTPVIRGLDRISRSLSCRS